MSKPANIDWGNLGFSYIKTDFRYISSWKDGSWDEGKLVTDNKLTITRYRQHCIMDNSASKG